jgi:selenocysteine lyase/cysteine desulfurase
LLYVADDAHDRLDQRRIGYRSVTDPGAEGYEYRRGAPRFEVGTTTPAPYVALATAIDTVETIGYDTIQSRVERLTDRLKAGLGERCLSPHDYESGLVTFTADDPEATVDRLAEAGIVVRSLPHPGAVRASVHAVNTADEIDQLLAALDRA